MLFIYPHLFISPLVYTCNMQCLLSRPKFGCIVVKKRINTRFFADFRGQLVNPTPGTVVDSEVTKPNW